ncbi:MAG TPA: tRNA pseudouridine(55) synthase TruB [Nevskiaceae bacterium]|nr:tRNA pseudouridine(55) synthase TruB [Nevskiaceae bacterium]
MELISSKGTRQQKIARPRRAVNGILLLDKPLNLSSNQALQQAKRLYQADKAGHTGSLDPLATGMLPICFGRATKLSHYLLDSHKRYLAVIRFGERTETGDAEGAVVAYSDASTLTRVRLSESLQKFVGVIEQVPPMYSALKREGRPLYELARAGIEVERAARRVNIDELKVVSFEAGLCELEVACSKGTYIRTLAEDIAAACGQVAHLAALRRLYVRPYEGLPMQTLDQIQAAASRGLESLDALLLSPATALRGWPELRLDQEAAARLRHGQAVAVGRAPPGTALAVGGDGQLLAIVHVESGMAAPRRWLAD